MSGLRLRSFVQVLMVVVVAALSLSTGASALTAEEASSNLNAANAEVGAVEGRIDAATGDLQVAEEAVAPKAAAAERAAELAEEAEAEVAALEGDAELANQAAAAQVAQANQDYEDEKSERDSRVLIGVVLLAVGVLGAVALIVVAKVAKLDLKGWQVGLGGGIAGFLALAGLLVFVTAPNPSRPELSAETVELAEAAEGEPSENPTPELEAALGEMEPLVETRDRLEAAVEQAEGPVAAVETELAALGRELRGAQADKRTATRKLGAIEYKEHAQEYFEEEATTIDYGQLIKNPEKYRGTKVVYTGQIFQIQEEFGETFMLLSVTDEGYGFWVDEIWVDGPSTEAAEEDIVTVYGTIVGAEEYETQGGGTNYVPRMRAKYIVE